MDATGDTVDFGGFLGIGKTRVGISYDERTFLVTDDDIVRMYMDATPDRIRSRRSRTMN